MICTVCKNDLPSHRRECPSCGEDNGFPNVRLTQLDSEAAALSKRYNAAIVSADARGAKKTLLRFEAAVATSKVVISRPLGVIQGLIEDERQSYVSFQRQVKAGLRSANDNIYDQVREQYESALYPHFSDEIIFGSLTLNSRGITSYGKYAMVLRTDMVSRRTTVFEENPHKFISKHRILGNQPITPGYRANWDGRSMLAVAKLQPDIGASTGDEEFPSILQKDVGDTGEADFIEAHIYGSVNRNAIESVVGPKPVLRADRIIWAALVQRMNNAGIEAREI